MHRKMIVLLSCGLMAASAASAGGAGAKPTTKPTAMPAAKCMSIADTVANNAQFSTLLVALQAAGLVDTLKSGQYTVFAPTDAAFNKLPSDVLSGVLNDPALLKSVLLYHVVPGKVNAKQVMNLKSIKTAQGATLSVQMMGSKVMVNGANVVQADVPACNGVIHVVDTVLLPPMTAMKPAAPAVAATPAPAPAATDDTMTSDNGMADDAASTDTGMSDAAAPADAMPAEMAQAPAAATPSSIPATPLTMPMPVDSGEMSVDTTVATDTAATDTAAADTAAATTETAAADTATADTTMADTTTVDTAADATMSDTSMGDNTIYDVIVNDDRFGTLRSLLSDADLTETLMGGTYTLFAPTDEAFAKVDPDTLAKIASDPELLKQVLLYHVVAGNLTGEQVTGSTQLASAEGQSLNVTKDGNNVKINDATVTAVDMKASNGVVHVIDSVLIPPDLKLP
ncbi:fasciclin domain-containing protein [Deinococcus psychrotolerans]|uniref:Fasciclin domain-containing protein n=1 Tax=Deinococcus psychrotolerans TaxID=2489213 RepID=A0A3G8YB24_9DEIO|nr:fasciclin domain-containing protein [Deinococcus psychrotolerans]AZI42130.1 fasciclin domain-containing protein [Deinococcus psychrotolerans]